MDKNKTEGPTITQIRLVSLEAWVSLENNKTKMLDPENFPLVYPRKYNIIE